LQPNPRLCVIIVSYGRPEDVHRCLASLARSTWQDFAVFICENAGVEAFARLCDALAGPDGVLEPAEGSAHSFGRSCSRLVSVANYRLPGTAIPVRLGAARENLGYGGGVNAWLEGLSGEPGWEAVLVLNPDTEIEPACLAKLIAKAAEGYGMVGATLVFDDAPNSVMSYGLIWSRLSGRVVAAGRDQPAGTAPPPALLARLDAVSGACVLVTRAFVEEVGPMAEDYFLYMEDIDWGMRRGRHRIGVAAGAVVRHVGGTATGYAVDPRQRSLLSVYLGSRNGILFARRHLRWLWPLHLAGALCYAAKYAFSGAPDAGRLALAGIIYGVRGETGRPARFDRARDG
jgi:hypothetical protein